MDESSVSSLASSGSSSGSSSSSSSRDNINRKRRAEQLLKASTSRAFALKTSKYRGVSFLKGKGLWRARIEFDGKRMHLGCFRNEDDAARKYDEKSFELHGHKGIFNFPEDIKKRYPSKYPMQQLQQQQQQQQQHMIYSSSMMSQLPTDVSSLSPSLQMFEQDTSDVLLLSPPMTNAQSGESRLVTNTNTSANVINTNTNMASDPLLSSSSDITLFSNNPKRIMVSSDTGISSLPFKKQRRATPLQLQSSSIQSMATFDDQHNQQYLPSYEDRTGVHQMLDYVDINQIAMAAANASAASSSLSSSTSSAVTSSSSSSAIAIPSSSSSTSAAPTVPIINSNKMPYPTNKSINQPMIRPLQVLDRQGSDRTQTLTPKVLINPSDGSLCHLPKISPNTPMSMNMVPPFLTSSSTQLRSLGSGQPSIINQLSESSSSSSSVVKHQMPIGVVNMNATNNSINNNNNNNSSGGISLLSPSTQLRFPASPLDPSKYYSPLLSPFFSSASSPINLSSPLNFINQISNNSNIVLQEYSRNPGMRIIVTNRSVYDLGANHQHQNQNQMNPFQSPSSSTTSSSNPYQNQEKS